MGRLETPLVTDHAAKTRPLQVFWSTDYSINHGWPKIPGGMIRCSYWWPGIEDYRHRQCWIHSQDTRSRSWKLRITLETNIEIRGPRLNMNTPSFQRKDSHYKDKTVSRPSYLFNGKSPYLERRSLCTCIETRPWIWISTYTRIHLSGVVVGVITECTLYLQADADAAKFMTVYSVIFEVPCVLLAFFWGSYSDYIGRKRALLLPVIGSLARVIIAIVAVSLKLNIFLLYLGCIIDGLFGGPAVFLGAVFAYIADITNMDNRSQRTAVIQAMVVFGPALSQLVVGYTIDYAGFLFAYIIAACVIVINLLYIKFWVLESVQTLRPCSFFRLQHVKNTVMLFFRDDGTGRLWKLQVLDSSDSKAQWLVQRWHKVGMIVTTLGHHHWAVCEIIFLGLTLLWRYIETALTAFLILVEKIILYLLTSQNPNNIYPF